MRIFRFGFRRGDDRRMKEAFETLDVELGSALALPAPGLIEVERWKSDELMDELRSDEAALETQIAAFTEELRQVRHVIRAEIVRARVLFSDDDYSPEADALGSHDAVLAAKKARGDKHFRKPVQPVSEAAE